MENSAQYYGTREIQEYLLPIMLDIDRICRENDIRYSLFGGGLLGAVRHRGFVPWDDDLDVIFTRAEFERFLEAFEKDPGDNMIVSDIWVRRVTRRDNPDAADRIGCIDLFVFDNVPDGKAAAGFKHFMLKLLQGMMKNVVRYDKYAFKQKVLAFGTHALGKLFSYKTKLRMYDRVSQWGNKKPTRYINNYVTYYNMISSLKYDASVPDGYTRLAFEGHMLSVFSHYDEALKTQFGEDYMTPVPMEQRVQKHLRGQ